MQVRVLSDFRGAEAFLRGKTVRKLYHNTWVERDGNDEINVRFHNTVIVAYHRAGGATLRTGGWMTVTTKARLNNLVPSGWSVYQKDWDWFLRFGGCRELDFVEGVRVYPDGGSVTPRAAKQATDALSLAELVEGLQAAGLQVEQGEQLGPCGHCGLDHIREPATVQ
jgi:hypothetical protein